MKYQNNKYKLKFDRVIDDPYNDLIPRTNDSGTIDADGNIISNSGIKIVPNSYCGEFTDILIHNRGVHEASQEYFFGEILNRIKSDGVNDNNVMIELGSYWAYYSLWYKKVVGGKCICVEPNIHKLNVGKKHFEINGYEAEFINGKIGKYKIDINLNDLVRIHKLSHIDIIHADIQRAEVEMLYGGGELFSKHMVDYVFISSHSNQLHDECMRILDEYGYHILFEQNVDQSYFGDGLIIAGVNNVKLSLLPKFIN